MVVNVRGYWNPRDNVNFVAGETVPNLVVSKTGSEGAVSMLLSRALVELVAVLDGRRAS